MNTLRVTLAAALFCLWSLAAAGEYDWAIQKLPRDLEHVDKSTFTVGTIEKQWYLAIHINAGDET